MKSLREQGRKALIPYVVAGDPVPEQTVTLMHALVAKGADIVAAVTTGEIDHKKILRMLKKELPSIAVPREFHVLEDLPLMGSGKVNFREVEKICRKLEKDRY